MKKGFTLIELLIVVAIIAILAAIAVPNFLEAQTRAKISRAKADMRSMATGLEVYTVDNNAYPLCNNDMLPGAYYLTQMGRQFWTLEQLSTPIAYMTTGWIQDPFLPEKRVAVVDGAGPDSPRDILPSQADKFMLQKLIKYGALQLAVSGSLFADTSGPPTEKGKGYLLYSSGPDRIWPGMSGIMTATQEQTAMRMFYDATNGTVSPGEIWRSGGVPPYGSQAGTVFFRHLFAYTSK